MSKPVIATPMRKPVVVEASIHDTVDILGHQIGGLHAIMDAVEVTSSVADYELDRNGRKRFFTKPLVSGCASRQRIFGLHVLEVYESYLCFDGSDYAYDHRMFRNFFFLSQLRCYTPEQILELAALKRCSNLELSRESLPELALPSAYYPGEGDKMLYYF